MVLKKKILIAFLFAFFLACASGKILFPLPETLFDADKAPALATLEKLRDGRRILITSCSTCHRAYSPSEYSKEEWKPIIPKMSALASLGKGDEKKLKAYVILASKKSAGSNKNIKD